MDELHLTKKDFRVDWFSGKGGGGQHRNKHRNCCRITHIDSGKVTTGQSHKSRVANQKEAFDKLARLLIAYYCHDESDSRRCDGERIRTYHAERNQVIDHASGIKQTYQRVVLGEDIADLVEARRLAKGNE